MPNTTTTSVNVRKLRKIDAKGAKAKQHLSRCVGRTAKTPSVAPFKFGLHSLKPITYISAEEKLGVPVDNYSPEITSYLQKACHVLGIDTENNSLPALTDALNQYSGKIGCQFALDYFDDKEEYPILVFYRECDTSDNFIHLPVKDFLNRLKPYNQDWIELLKELLGCLWNNSMIAFYMDDDYYIEERMEEMADPEYWENSIEEGEEGPWLDYQDAIRDYTSGDAREAIESIKSCNVSPTALLEKIQWARETSFKDDAVKLAELCLKPKRYHTYNYFPHRYLYQDGDPTPLFETVSLVVDRKDLYYDEIQQTIQANWQEYGQEIPHTCFKVDINYPGIIPQEDIAAVVNDTFPDEFYKHLLSLCDNIENLDKELWKILN